jgi:hypothetical protein
MSLQVEVRAAGKGITMETPNDSKPAAVSVPAPFALWTAFMSLV